MRNFPPIPPTVQRFDNVKNLEKQGEPSIPPSTRYSLSEPRSKSVITEGKCKEHGFKICLREGKGVWR